MSKFEITAIVLCAVFFVSESRTTSFRSLDKDPVNPHINYAMKLISDRAAELRRELFLIKMLPIGEKAETNAETIDRFKSQIQNDIALARDFVDDIIENTTRSFNKTKCRSFSIDYEKSALDLISHLDVSTINAINETVTQVEEAIAVATAAIEKLESLKIQAHVCQGYVCYDMIQTSEFTSADVLQKTKPALCSSARLKNGSKVNEGGVYRYIDYGKKSTDLIEKTLKCVNSSH